MSKKHLHGIRALGLLGLALVLSVARPGSAHEGDAAFLALPYEAGYRTELTAPPGADAADPAAARLAHVVEQAGRLATPDGRTLLPAGTRLEQFRLDELLVAHVDLTVPADKVGWQVQPIVLASIEHVLANHLDLPELNGLAVRVRVGAGEYAPLDSYQPALAPLPPDSTISDDTGRSAAQAIRDRLDLEKASAQTTEGFGSPFTNADGPPQGALSGVVVFISAGHGWTNKSGGWYLQRPLLLNMVEDYGNLDQLNLFASYLYNAGAVVVPFRPVGYQTVEIVLDNDDAGVTYTGTWTDSTTTSGYYENGVTSGPPYRYAAGSATESAVARYTPTIPSSDFYPVYTWVKDDTDRVDQLYRVRHSGGTAELRIDHARVGKGWVWLGNYHFEAGTGGYVEISNASTLSGIVVADAIRFGIGIGDVVGDYTSTISGYPKDEEASRYWAEGEARFNAVGLPSSIWDCCTDDGSDNVGTAARWSAYMNRDNVNNERWRRAYVEWHTNAAGCGQSTCTAKGTIALVSSTSPTLNQTQFSTIVGDKIEADMLAIDNTEFEFLWGARSNPYSGAFGAISVYNNDDEFDATLIELAFHDNTDDAANLRNVKVRATAARSATQGLIQFLSNGTTFPGTQVVNVYPPEPPIKPRARHNGLGGIVLNWAAPPSGGANGSAATGYKIYRSSNGYGFGNAVVLGNVLTHTLTDIPADTTTYLRIAATNAGGESMPTETLAVRWSWGSTTPVIVVNGFDRISRQQNAIQNIPAGAMERQIARKVNTFDYIVAHARALGELGLPFDSGANEAVADNLLPLGDYQAAVWILGEESTIDQTFSTTERTRVSDYLNAGGRLFVTGSEIAYELIGQAVAPSFCQTTLGAGYVGDDAGTYNVVGSGGILADVGSFNFNPASGAPYDADAPDRLAAQSGGAAVLSYVGGTGGTAGVQYAAGTSRVVTFGFPFETITSAPIRTQIMERIMDWFGVEAGPVLGCPAALLTDFEGYNPGNEVLFQNPRYSPSTSGDLAASPDTAGIVLGSFFNGLHVEAVEWSWIDTDPQRWLRLTTNNVNNVPNPTVYLDRPIRLRCRLGIGSMRVCLGIRETGVEVPVGSDGGNTGTIEWVGASSVINGAPQGALITGGNLDWSTLTFVPTADAIQPFTGDGVLSSPNNKGVLEHLALSVVGDAGPHYLELDLFEQLCPLRTDLDDDGDVDQDDFAQLQICLTGADTPTTDTACYTSDLDGDTDVDGDDVGLIRACLRGPGITPDPACVE